MKKITEFLKYLHPWIELLIAALAVYIAWEANIKSEQALKTSIEQGEIARNHNQLSVKPVVKVKADEATGRISLWNKGLGPAVIDRVLFVSKNDQKVIANSGEELFFSLKFKNSISAFLDIPEFTEYKKAIENSQWNPTSEFSIIQQDGKELIIQFTNNKIPLEVRTAMFHFLYGDYVIKVYYQSMYYEKMDSTVVDLATYFKL
jgi:hypothetical protein